MATLGHDSQDVTLQISQSTPKARDSQDVSLNISESSVAKIRLSQSVMLTVLPRVNKAQQPQVCVVC